VRDDRRELTVVRRIIWELAFHASCESNERFWRFWLKVQSVGKPLGCDETKPESLGSASDAVDLFNVFGRGALRRDERMEDRNVRRHTNGRRWIEFLAERTNQWFGLRDSDNKRRLGHDRDG
jgi:hypothetical protein